MLAGVRPGRCLGAAVRGTVGWAPGGCKTCTRRPLPAAAARACRCRIPSMTLETAVSQHMRPNVADDWRAGEKQRRHRHSVTLKWFLGAQYTATLLAMGCDTALGMFKPLTGTWASLRHSEHSSSKCPYWAPLRPSCSCCLCMAARLSCACFSSSPASPPACAASTLLA